MLEYGVFGRYDNPQRSKAISVAEYNSLLVLMVRLTRCAKNCIAVLCACCRTLKTNENPTLSGTFFTAYRPNMLWAPDCCRIIAR
jgi:hypothetical protein